LHLRCKVFYRPPITEAPDSKVQTNHDAVMEIKLHDRLTFVFEL